MQLVRAQALLHKLVSIRHVDTAQANNMRAPISGALCTCGDPRHSEHMEDNVTKKQQQAYEDTNKLREILDQLKYRKFKLDCGHHVTWGYFLGNDITIRNGKTLRIICSQCGY